MGPDPYICHLKKGDDARERGERNMLVHFRTCGYTIVDSTVWLAKCSVDTCANSFGFGDLLRGWLVVGSTNSCAVETARTSDNTLSQFNVFKVRKVLPVL